MLYGAPEIRTCQCIAESNPDVDGCVRRRQAALMSHIYSFDAAIVRRPGLSVVTGLRAHDRGSPTYAGVCAEHDSYVQALQAAGVRVDILEPLEAFPDSVFVEDPALVFSSGAIVLRPGAPSRAGESEALRPVLQRHFNQVLTLAGGCVDGGDVMLLPDKVLVGLSARTSRQGAESLLTCLAQFGQRGHVVKTPDHVLHLKSDAALLDDSTVLCTARLAASQVFSGFKQIIVPQGEEAAANALRVNDRVFVGQDYPRTLALLRAAGYVVAPLPTAEIAKIDAGLSCMSLRWQQAGASNIV